MALDLEKEIERIFQTKVPRKKFLKYSLAGITLSLLPAGLLCSNEKRSKDPAIPGLKGLSAEHYKNINSMAEVFLEGSPVKNFDTGKKLDEYLYNGPVPPSIEKKLNLLLMIPSSFLVSFLIDFSFTPMTKLSVKERERRLKKWKYSSITLKKAAYNAFRQTCLLLLTSSKEYQYFTGYTEKDYFRPF